MGRVHRLAVSVHLLTASGAALALMALVAATRDEWPLMFCWLGLALLVDGIDGPLARKVEIEKNAPHWDGAVLDLVIDYLTYVFIPAFALVGSGLVPGWWGLAAALVVTLTGVVYFSDVRMKNPDNTFSGFPAAWQMVVLALFTLEPDVPVALVLITLLAVAQFMPIKFIHPVRTARWRAVSLPMTVAWIGFAGWSVWENLDPPGACQLGLVITSLWLLCSGLGMQLIPAHNRAA